MANNPNEVFQALIEGLRYTHKLSVQEICARTGISRTHLYRLSNGEIRRPGFDTIERLQRLQRQLVAKAARPRVGC
jgi:transcriptional regulator with XRE-family HTH domain